MAKWMTALDSARQIGLSTLPNDDLMAVRGFSSVDPKNAKSETLSAIPQQPAIVMENGLRHLIRRAQ